MNRPTLHITKLITKSYARLSKTDIDKKWKEKITGYSLFMKDIIDDNTEKQLDSIKNQIGLEKLSQIKSIAESYILLNEIQKEYIDRRISDDLIKNKGLSAIDINTDWISISTSSDTEPQSINPNYFEQQEKMSLLTKILKEKKGIDFGFGGGTEKSKESQVKDVKNEEVKVVEKEKEKQIYDLYLQSYEASKKITVIKAVREVTGLGLKEAKELVETAPQKLKDKVKKDEIKVIIDKIEAAGGKVEAK